MKGLAFHCHHDVLVEYVYDFEERVEFIKSHKPLAEQALRLRLFRLIPEERIPRKELREWAACDKAWVACGKAQAAYDKAWVARDKAQATCDKAWAAYDKAWAACGKAGAACGKAWAAYDKAYKGELEALHKELCPDCSWDGETIFTRRDEKGEWC